MPTIHLTETNHEVTIYDFLPQIIFERIEELSTAGIKFDVGKYNCITIDDVAEALGADVAQTIQNEQDDLKRDVLFNDARHQMVMKDVSVTVGVSDTHKINRAKLDMVERVTGPNCTWPNVGTEKWADFLPHTDYEQLITAIDEVMESSKTKAAKKNGQSPSSSSGQSSLTPQKSDGQEAQ